MKIRRRDSEDASVDMSPMIDMVFLLLIFFIVASAIVDEKPSIDVPSATYAKVPEDIKGRFMVTAKKDGSLLAGLRGTPVSVEALKEMLGKEIEAELEVRVESSGWLAVRVLGPTQHGVMDSYLFAHTNPVFLIADGEPIRSSEDAAFFVRWVDQNLETLRGRRWYDPAQRAEVIAPFEEARRLYQAQVDGR